METVHGILKEGLVAHVAFVKDGYPVCLPMAYARREETLYLHGSITNSMLKTIKKVHLNWGKIMRLFNSTSTCSLRLSYSTLMCCYQVDQHLLEWMGARRRLNSDQASTLPVSGSAPWNLKVYVSVTNLKVYVSVRTLTEDIFIQDNSLLRLTHFSTLLEIISMFVDPQRSTDRLREGMALPAQ